MDKVVGLNGGVVLSYGIDMMSGKTMGTGEWGVEVDIWGLGVVRR